MVCEQYSIVLGELSRIKFKSVARTFISEFSKEEDTDYKDSKQEWFILSTDKLQLKIYPMEDLQETSVFLKNLAVLIINHFNTNKTPRIKHAYCETITALLDPVAAVHLLNLDH